MNLTAWVATVHLLGAVLTVVWLLSDAPDRDLPGMASRRVIVVRSVILASIWPLILILFAAAEVFPRFADWIRHGSGDGS